MKASEVRVHDLKTFSECMDAIESIESDWKNISGGLKAWNSGYTTYLTAAAERKISAIKRKADKLSPPDEE